MTTEQVARFHLHLCPACAARVGCSSPACDRQTAAVSHPLHWVPEPAHAPGDDARAGRHHTFPVRRMSRYQQLEALADSGCDTWEEYRGEK